MKDPTALGPGRNSGGGRHPHGGGGSGAKKQGILRGKKVFLVRKKQEIKWWVVHRCSWNLANRRANKMVRKNVSWT